MLAARVPDDESTYAQPCQPDNLYNHDTGDLLADVEFINAIGGELSWYVPSFNGSVTSRYCISRVAAPFADYVSCNGLDTEHYHCDCNLFADRCIGRQDTSPCHSRLTPSGSSWPLCECSAESTATSAKYIGSTPVYYPFPAFHGFRHAHNCSDIGVPPRESSVYLGEWYSLPAASECAPDAIALPGASGCTWARRAIHHFVHGFELLATGFNLTHNYDSATLRHNSEVVARTFAKHQARCCDC